MADFIKNAIMLYREKEDGIEIEGKKVEYKQFDQDDETAMADALDGKWKTHAEIWGKGSVRMLRLDLIKSIIDAKTKDAGGHAYTARALKELTTEELDKIAAGDVDQKAAAAELLEANRKEAERLSAAATAQEAAAKKLAEDQKALEDQKAAAAKEIEDMKAQALKEIEAAKAAAKAGT